MKRNYIHKIVLAGVLLAIVVIFQLIKNISAFISGPVINTVLVIATIELGLVWGIAFSVGVPLLSLLFAPAAPMSLMTHATSGATLILVMLGNIIFILLAYFLRNKKLYWFIPALLVGATLKWLAMWLGADYIIKPIFEDDLGKLVNALTKVFSTLQLYSGLLSIVLIVPTKLALDKIYK